MENKKCLKPPTSIQVMMWTVFYKTDEFSPLFAIGSNYNRYDCLIEILASFCREWQLLQQMCGIQIPTPTMQCMHYLILQSSEILPDTKTMSPYKHSCRTCMRQKYANRMMNSCIFVCQSCLLEGRIQGFGCEVQSVAEKNPVSPIKSQCLLLK